LAIGAHRFESPDPAALRAIGGKPAMAIWGEADRTLGAQHFLPQFAGLFPQAPIHRLPRAGHSSLEDSPAEIAGLVPDFLQRI